MIKRKRVYICDYCNNVALESIIYALDGNAIKNPPCNWTKLGKLDLCPICSEALAKFRQEINSNSEKGNKIHVKG